MRQRNAFKITSKRLEYTEFIKAAVLDPSIKGLNINLNGGWDWIDSRYGFIKLLLSRGQVQTITSGSDLLARQDYLEAVRIGFIHNRSGISISLEARTSDKKSAYASPKRIDAANARLDAFKQEMLVAS